MTGSMALFRLPRLLAIRSIRQGQRAIRVCGTCIMGNHMPIVIVPGRRGHRRLRTRILLPRGRREGDADCIMDQMTFLDAERDETIPTMCLGHGRELKFPNMPSAHQTGSIGASQIRSTRILALLAHDDCGPKHRIGRAC